MIKRHKSYSRQQPYFRINERIVSLQLRVLDLSGKQIGVLSKFEALTKAREEGLDLVEVAPNAKPPVARIVNFKKFLYQQEKKKREEKRKTKTSETKEVRLSPFIEDHDLGVRIKKARGFLEDNNKVRFVLKFKGRQIIHPEFGQEVIRNVIQSLSDISKIEREPHFEGKQLIALIVPDKSAKSSVKQNAKEGELDENENKEVSSQEV